MCPDSTPPKEVQFEHGNCHSNEREGADDGGNPRRLVVASRITRIAGEGAPLPETMRDVNGLYGGVSL